MTEPNPFSTVNSLNHLVNPKIVSDGPTGYQVQVDIANVDTFYGRQLGGTANQFAQAYIQQIGTTGVPTQQAFIQQLGSTGSSGAGYFNTINWKEFNPPIASISVNGITLQQGPGIELTTQPSGQFVSSRIFGGPGISVNSPANGQPYIISSSSGAIVGSTGITVQTVGSTATISSAVSVIGGTNILVQQNGALFTVNYTGSGGSGPPSGVSGSYAVFDSSGNLSSSTVLRSSNVVGPTGQVMLYSPQGPTSSSLLSLTGRTLNTPTVVVHDSIAYPNETGKYLRLTADTQSTFIQSGTTENPNSSAPLQISGYYGGPVLTTFDIPQGKVTINPGAGATFNYPYGVRVFGASSVSQSVPVPGGTYNVYLWGGGGSGSLFPGGAGGYVKIQNVYGPTGVALRFDNIPSVAGGGNSLALLVNGATAAIAPGGGGGGTAGAGAAYGETGGSYPGQGFSAGVTGGSGGRFLQGPGVPTPAYYTLTGNYSGSGGTFSRVPVTYGTTGTIASGSVITVLGTNVSLNSFTGLYTFGNGASLVFNTPGMTFTNSVYGLTGVTYGFFDSLSFAGVFGYSSGIFPGFAGISGNTAGFSVSDPQNPSVVLSTEGALVGASFQNYTGPIGLSGNTYSVAPSSTLQLTPGSIFNTDTINGVSTITLNTDDAFIFSQSLGGTITNTRLTGFTGISGTAVVQVGNTFSAIYGQNGSSLTGGNLSGGGGFFGGGGGIAGGGGGAGSAIIQGGFSGVTGPGSGRSPFPDTYNLSGSFGFGGSGGAGGQSYYVIEQVSAGLSPDVLQVNGNENIAGGLTVDTPGITIKGPTNSSSLLTSTVTGGGAWRLNVRNGLNVGEGLSGADANFSGLITANAGVTASSAYSSGLVTAIGGLLLGSSFVSPPNPLFPAGGGEYSMVLSGWRIVWGYEQNFNSGSVLYRAVNFDTAFSGSPVILISPVCTANTTGSVASNTPFYVDTVVNPLTTTQFWIARPTLSPGLTFAIAWLAIGAA